MKELIQKAQKGDIEAYTKLIQTLEKDLYRIASTRLSNNEDICDCIQNTMINVYHHIKKLKKYEYFKTWVIKILLNECNKIYKENFKRNKIFEKAKLNIINKKELSEDIYDFKQFDNMIASLNSDEQLVFTLYYKDKYSCREISKIIGIKENTIKSKLNRGREKLKRNLEEELKNYETR